MVRSVQALLLEAEQQLKESDTPRLDAEILLAASLGRNRAFLYAWPEHEPDNEQAEQFSRLILKRTEGYPVAYLVGKKEFWSLDLVVNEAVLIPRPDTERLVEVVLEHFPLQTLSVLDLGTGSGAIALALASEMPGWSVTASDNSEDALACAEENRKCLQLGNVNFVKSDWCAALPDASFQVIVSNPPYIAPGDPHLQSGGLDFEPQDALVSDDNGLADIKKIAKQSPRILTTGGWLFLEHGYEQASAVQAIMQETGFTDVITWQDMNGLDRVTGGQLNK